MGKCPVCGRPVVDIVRHTNGDVEYIHGRYTTFTDFCRENAREKARREEQEKEE